MAWDDLQRSSTIGKGATIATFEAFRDTPFRMAFFRHNADVDFSYEYQMPHTWDPRRSVRPHLHVIPMANGAGNVRMTGYIYWARCNVAIPVLASWTPFTVDTAYIAADQYQARFISLGTFTPPAGVQESDILMLFVQRPGLSDAADTYATNKDHGTAAANLGLLSADAHYEPVKRGTETEFGPV